MPFVHKPDTTEGPSVLLLPGIPGDAAYFERLLPHLEGLSVAVGQFVGAEGELPEGNLLDVIEADVREMVCAFAEPPVVVGVSAGAYFAGRVAMDDSVRVRHLVLVSGIPGWPKEIGDSRREMAAGLQSGALPKDALLTMGEELFFGPSFDDSQAIELALHYASGASAERLAALIGPLGDLDQPERQVRGVRTPATVIHAKDDGMVPFALGEELAKAVGADGVVAVDSASHILPLTHPEQIARAIKSC